MKAPKSQAIMMTPGGFVEHVCYFCKPWYHVELTLYVAYAEQHTVTDNCRNIKPSKLRRLVKKLLPCCATGKRQQRQM